MQPFVRFARMVFENGFIGNVFAACLAIDEYRYVIKAPFY